ncbi:MAG: ATP-binding cassette domain-containing protein [Ktedonobacteraceae bacterium]
MDTSMPMIEACELRRSFKAKEAVAGISFSTRRGEIFGLLGPNGAGKTTTIRMLTGQIDPSSGSAVVAGCDVVKERARLKQRIGVVFEEQNLYERLSAWHNLEFSCWLYGLPNSRIDEVLELVRLRDRARDGVHTFSNGMKQRLMIARALLHRPPMLFLDEPSRGLDPISAREVRQAIQQLCAEGMTILLTTHLMEEADQLCHQVAFIVNGRLVANDTPRNLKIAHRQHEMSVTVAEEGQTKGHEGQPWREVTLHFDDVADQQQLAQWMAEGKVLTIHSHEATLEEVFIEVTSVTGVRPV